MVFSGSRLWVIFFKFFRKLCHKAGDRHCCRITQSTDSCSHHVSSDSMESFHFSLVSFSFQKILDNQSCPMGYFAAGCTLPTGLMIEETGDSVKQFDNVGILVKDHHSSRTHHRPRFSKSIETVFDINLFCGQNRR